MMKENKSLYDRVVCKHRFIEQNNDDFLSGCDISPNTDDAKKALGIRKILSYYSNPSVKDNQILWNYRVGKDLNINSLDSLNLVDVSIDIEKETGIKLSDSMILEIKRMNENDVAVAEIVKFFIHDKTKA